ncbi:cupin domain-containing protein, partial [Streptosporangium algeriense]
MTRPRNKTGTRRLTVGWPIRMWDRLIMDFLDDYLGGVRARGAVFCRSVVEPPWNVRFTGPVPLGLVTVLTGDAWILMDGSAPEPLRRGDVALIR